MSPRSQHPPSHALTGLVVLIGLLGTTVAILRSETGAHGDTATADSRRAREGRLPGGSSAATDDRPAPTQGAAEALRLALPQDTAIAFSTLSGRVHDEHGIGVPHATVELAPPGFMVFFAPRRRVETGDDGSWTAERISGGRWRVRAWADGYLTRPPRVLSIPPASTVDGIDVRLAADTRILGQLRDADGATPQGQMVQLLGPSGSERVDRTDGSGRFGFDGLGPGSWRLNAWPGGERDVTLTQGQTARVELGLRRPPTVRGRVLHQGRPVADAWVSAHLLEVAPNHRRDHDLALGTRPRPRGLLSAELQPGGVTTRVTTDGLGEFRLAAHHAPGDYALVATAGGSPTPPVVVHVAWDADELVDLAFGDGALSGQVVSAVDGRPLPGVPLVATHVALGSRWPAALSDNALFRTPVTSDGAGNFRIEGLAAGRYRVEVDDTTYLTSSSPPVEVRTGELTAGTRLELTRAASVRGSVRRSGAALPAGTVVRLQALGERRDVRLARVETSGRYEFVGLAAGSYEAVVCGRPTTRSGAHEALVEVATVYLAAGSTRQLDFDIARPEGGPRPQALERPAGRSGTRRP